MYLILSCTECGLCMNVKFQIALFLPIRGRTKFGKMFGIDCRRFFFSPTPPPSHSFPANFTPILCSPQARFFPGPLARSLRQEKEKKRLLRRLVFSFCAFCYFCNTTLVHHQFQIISGVHHVNNNGEMCTNFNSMRLHKNLIPVYI